MKKRTRIIIIALVLLIILPIGKHYIIGPRNLTDGGDIYAQEIYYMFHTYKCVGWTMSGADSYEKGLPLGYDLFESFYTAKGKKGVIINYSPHEKYIYKRWDKLLDD